MNLSEFQNRIGYTFRDKARLELALTHRSYAFEHGTLHCDNQRLEFLGDAVLDLVIGDILYHQYPNAQEGELSRLRSRLVCEGALCILAHQLDFESHILMGKGEISTSGMMRPGTLADAYEAVIGAIYLDGGIDAARDFIKTHHQSLLKDPDGQWMARDAKTRLQEITQIDHLEPKYRVVDERGPEHAPTFVVEVYIVEKNSNLEKILGKGFGKSKKDAQQAAAAKALEQLKK